MMTNPDSAESTGSNESIASTESEAQLAVRRIIAEDRYRMQCLTALNVLNLPQGYLGAGFLRNAIWDDIHGYGKTTPLNDIDVIYFNPTDTSKQTDKSIEQMLAAMVPSACWQVKNQARMHLHHGHRAYKDCEDAISYWIEKETCVAIRCSTHGNKDVSEQVNAFDILAPYGLVNNFAGTISINPRYPRVEVFTQRVVSKRWMDTWPKLILGEV